MQFKHLFALTALLGLTIADGTGNKTVTVTVTATTTTTACPSPSYHSLTGLSVGFGADPLTVTGSGNYLGYSTPSNVTGKSNSGAGYLQGRFAAGTQNGYFDVLSVAATAPVLGGASYTFRIAGRHTAPESVFCFLYMQVDGTAGGRFNLGGDWSTNAVFFTTSASQSTADVLAYSNCINGNSGPVVPYSVLYDDVIVEPA